MDKLHLDQHISQQFNNELEDIRNRALAMGGLVEKQVENGLRALLDGDSELGEQVALADHQVNAMEVELDEACIQVLARRQPTASDLRLIVAVIKVITDLERIGDEAEKLGKLSTKLATTDQVPVYRKELRHLGELVKSILSSALDAFARMDVNAAITTAERDKDIDAEYESLSRLLITHIMDDPSQVKHALRIAWCARALERIGDHSVNLCEYVVYLVKGKDIRHTEFEQVQSEFLSNP